MLFPEIRMRVHVESMSLTDIKIPIPERVESSIPYNDIYLNRMFLLTLIPSIQSKYRLIKYSIPVICNCILIGATFCPLYYPAYYPTQAVVWSTDMALITIVYNYMLYLHTRWESANGFEPNSGR